MKTKVLSTLFLTAFAITMFAQHVLKDNSVVFSYDQNDVKSVNLLLDGRKIEMSKDDNGLYLFRSEPLEATLHTYTFEINGVEKLDPKSVHVMRDGERMFNYFIVPDSLNLLSDNDIPHGTVMQTWYQSNMITRRLSVYLPPSYYTSDKTYPVLYLLHGTWGDEMAWLELGRAAQIMDNMIAKRLCKEMIVVMPNENMWQTASPDYTQVNGFISNRDTHSQLTNGAFEMQFIDIKSFVEKTYRTTNNKQSRAIAGLSRGGYFAFHISHYHYSMFDYVGLFSATYRVPSNVNVPVYQTIDADLKAQFAAKPSLYYISIGKDDFLYDENVDFRHQLDSNGYRYVYNESRGGHEWRNWRDYLIDFLPRLFVAPTNQ